MNRQITYILLTLTLTFCYSCRHKHDFVIFERHEEDRGIAAIFVYTNSSDSIELLEYSENLRQSLIDSSCLYFFHFYHDSTKHASYYKGKVGRGKAAPYASYSNIYEKWKGINSQGHLEILK